MISSQPRDAANCSVGPVESPAQVETCDVCIVGAGLAGLNALFVASQYLNRDQKVILVDRRQRVGGMWVDTYPYVRLHQPHGMFTAGNITWTLNRDRSYLATKPEVLDHFAHCVNVIKQRVHVDEFYGCDFQSHEEISGNVRVACRLVNGQDLIIKAKRLIKAYGFRVTPNDPLEISSSRVASVSPDFCDVRQGEMGTGEAPVWIIGSGKTAMDTAHAIISQYPEREVNLVAGAGTYFLSRDRLFPVGARRWWGGTVVSDIAAQSARRFDGTNEAEVADWMRASYGVWLTPDTGNLFFGLLSESENATIAAGLNDVIMDYLVDVVDRGGATELMLRSGATKAISPGSWIVNCTGYVFRTDFPYEPYVSASGAVLSVQTRSATLHLTSLIAYFLTHLLFLDQITEVPLYELDAQELRDKARAATPYVLLSLLQYNMSLISDSLPRKALLDCGINLDAWYPLSRRMFGAARFAVTHRREREHHRRALDTVRERFSVRCGPLGH